VLLSLAACDQQNKIILKRCFVFATAFAEFGSKIGRKHMFMPPLSKRLNPTLLSSF